MEANELISQLTGLGIKYGLKVIAAILIWIIGSFIIKKLMKFVKKSLSKSKMDESLTKFLTNLIFWSLKILLIIIILGKLGIETTTFAAILAAAGLAVGMALQGSLANFAGGVLIMLFKPFKVGDLIEAQGELGVVKEIDIFTTKLVNPQNKLVIIPNGPLSNGNIKNYSAEGILTIFHTIGIDYDSDIKKAKEVLMNVMTSQEKVLKNPPPLVAVSEFGESSLNLAVRPSVKVEDYWDVYFETLEKAKTELNKAGIEIPYPHRVLINKQNKS